MFLPIVLLLKKKYIFSKFILYIETIFFLNLLALLRFILWQADI